VRDIQLETLRNADGKYLVNITEQKTKKKRGNYRGGKIDTSTYSIQFDSD
jgi:hypothetical protein